MEYAQLLGSLSEWPEQFQLVSVVHEKDMKVPATPTAQSRAVPMGSPECFHLKEAIPCLEWATIAQEERGSVLCAENLDT
ncbi:unnamed protein product [Strongylus vulgaris]|uniref:Uncharacterized protein n=1 Tax=Strongylus vulgaris TaxID=40348 RepID=A0A3P7IVV2_STRVU|nr:unnamed protein product [Strongylus vulgaris]